MVDGLIPMYFLPSVDCLASTENWQPVRLLEVWRTRAVVKLGGCLFPSQVYTTLIRGEGISAWLCTVVEGH